MPLVNGVLTRLYNFITDRDNGTKIMAERVNGEFDNFLSAINGLTSGAVALRGSLRNVSGTSAAPAYSFAEDTNTGVFRQAEDTLALTGGDTVFTVGPTTISVNGRPLVSQSALVSQPADSSAPSSGFVAYDETGAERARMFWARSTNSANLRVGDGTANVTLRINLADGLMFLNGSPIQTVPQAVTLNAIGPQAGFMRSSVAANYGATVAGSNLNPAAISSAGSLQVSAFSVPGTWECRGNCPAGSASNFVRIA